MDFETLRRILIIGKLNPEKIEILAERLEEFRKSYLLIKSLEKTVPANEIAKICDRVSKLTNKLLNVLSLDARGGIEVSLLLEKFGIESPKNYAMLYELYAASDEAALFMRKGIQGSITGALKEHFEYDEQESENEEEHEDQVEIKGEPESQPDEYEMRRRVGAAVLISSLVASKRKHGQTAETRLFLNLRELFIDLGGSTALSSKDLYEFSKACCETIDEKIRIPSQVSFWDLLKKATRRGAADLIE